MVKSAARRTAHYDAKMSNPDRVSPVIAPLLDGMKAAASVTNAEIFDFEARTRSLIAGTTVAPALVGRYLNFSRSIYSIVRKGIEGNALIIAVAALIAYYKSQGCVELNLIAIRDVIWTIPAPTGP